MRVWKRDFFVFFLCVFMALYATLFTSNLGYTHRSVAAGGAQGYLYLILTLWVCVGATWVYRYILTCEKFSRKDTRILVFCYWVPLIITGAIHFFNSDYLVYAGAGFFLWLILFVFVYKFYMSSKYDELTWTMYFEEFVCYGSMDIFEKTIDLSHGITENPYWVAILKIWWSFGIKFFTPWILWHLILIFDIGRLYGNQDKDQGYQGYTGGGSVEK